MKLKYNQVPIRYNFPNLDKYQPIIDTANLQCSKEELYLYLRYGDPQIRPDKNENNSYLLDTNICLWHRNKGDLTYLEGNTHYYYLLYLYTLNVKRDNTPEKLLVTKFNHPINTTDGIRYFSIGNYYSAMMSRKYDVRKYIAELSPYSALKYWDSNHILRSDWAFIREKVMYKALEWLLIKDSAVSIIDMDYITAYFYKTFPLFNIDQENKFWGVWADGNKTPMYGYNKLGSMISRILYKFLYEEIPF